MQIYMTAYVFVCVLTFVVRPWRREEWKGGQGGAQSAGCLLEPDTWPCHWTAWQAASGSGSHHAAESCQTVRPSYSHAHTHALGPAGGNALLLPRARLGWGASCDRLSPGSEHGLAQGSAPAPPDRTPPLSYMEMVPDKQTTSLTAFFFFSFFFLLTDKCCERVKSQHVPPPLQWWNTPIKDWRQCFLQFHSNYEFINNSSLPSVVYYGAHAVPWNINYP